jgi:hypothetical protein
MKVREFVWLNEVRKHSEKFVFEGDRINWAFSS